MSDQPAARRMTRSSDEKMIAGVCMGVAAYRGFDPALVRIGTVLLGFCTGPLIVIAYIVAWLVMPAAPTRSTA